MSPTLDVNLRCSVVLFRQDTLLLVRRDRADGQTWVLPGGNPEPGEGMACCAWREVLEETGLSVDVTRCAFVLEAITPDRADRTLEIVFLGSELRGDVAPRSREPDLRPEFIPLERLHDLPLLPPLADPLRSLRRSRADTAPFLGNLWRPSPARIGPRRVSGEGRP